MINNRLGGPRDMDESDCDLYPVFDFIRRHFFKFFVIVAVIVGLSWCSQKDANNTTPAQEVENLKW